MPDHRKICYTGKILCDSDSTVKIEYNMPPPTRNKYCLTRTLKYFNLEVEEEEEEKVNEDRTCSAVLFSLVLGPLAKMAAVS